MNSDELRIVLETLKGSYGAFGDVQGRKWLDKEIIKLEERLKNDRT